MFFRLEEPAVVAAVEAAPALPRVEVQMVHAEWLIVMLVGENGVEEVKRAYGLQEAVELAQNAVMLGMGVWDGKVEEVRALVA